MPHIEIDKREFEDLLGMELSDEELHEKASLLGAHWNHVEGHKWDVEVYPNRPDLLSVEGLARAYRGFFEVETGRKEYQSEIGDIEVQSDPSVEEVRPFIGGAVIRGLELTRKKINGLIQLQEKLHESVGRRRGKIAIGLHELSDIEPPFKYMAVEPHSVSFKPLEHQETMHLDEILNQHEKGKEYAWILEDEDKYPVITDKNDRVLSFPPIINNQLTEVTENTADIFIDVTGKDKETVEKVLNILVTALAERGGKIEKVEVDGQRMPDLSPDKKHLEPEYFRKISGIDLIGMRVAKRLEKMKFGAKVNEDSKLIDVEIPCYRNDVMHSYDLIEDAVIAHRYENVKSEKPDVDQHASRIPIEKFSDELRDAMIGTGASEAHTYILSSEEKLFDKMGVEKQEIAEMSNALTEDYAVARNWLTPSLMQVLKSNRHRKYPQKLFEIADVVKPDGSKAGASNERKMAFIQAGPEAEYTDAREVLQNLERYLGVQMNVEAVEKDFLEPGIAAEIYFQGEKLGFIGEIFEDVRQNWGLEIPVVSYELNVQKLWKLLQDG